MTPGARTAAAIDLLDTIGDGAPAEKALTGWARKNRYAGSKDRAAIRDLVFQALRCRRSYAARGGAGTGRGLMIGHLRATSVDPDLLFTGARYAPEPLDRSERDGGVVEAGMPDGVRMDFPDWVLPQLDEALGSDLPAVASLFQTRAPLWLRINSARTSRDAAQAALSEDGIETRPHRDVKTALEATENERKVARSSALAKGLVEVQDAASQAVCAAVPLCAGDRVLDYCAGGGGKALALAAREPAARIEAHDAAPRRMADLPSRAGRAGAVITTITQPDGLYDLVLADVPCSGSGTWRRSPQAKWDLTPERLADLTRLQAEILDTCAPFVAPGGSLAYATCSLLRAENETQVASFLTRHATWRITQERRYSPLDGGDGFYCAILTRA